MGDAWVLIVERREPNQLGPASIRVMGEWSFHDEVFGPFESQDDAWKYAISRGDDESDHAHDVQQLRVPS